MSRGTQRILATPPRPRSRSAASLLALAWAAPAGTHAAPAAAAAGFTGGPFAVWLGVAAVLGAGMAWLAARRRARREQRRHERVRWQIAQLERANTAKTTYVAHLSHEVRNPINGILGAALALSAEDLPPHQREHARTIQTCATLLSALVEDALDFTQIEAGRVDLHHAPYDPRAVLGAVARILAQQAREAGVTLGVLAGDDVPELVMGDATRVQQIVLNFTLNALKFAAGRPVELGVSVADGALVFAVADRGPGIDAAERDRLFANFSRLRAARLAGIQGSGLGLAVSRALAEHMGGTVGVGDRPGGGAVFRLRLQLQPAARIGRDETPAPAEFAGMRALVIDDLDYNATALEFILHGFGFACERARDADEALVLFGATSYDAVFVDYDLPGKNGIAFVRAAKAGLGAGRAPLFIATSAHATARPRQECLEAGMDAFVYKPITPERLRHTLRAFASPLRGSPSVQLPPPASAPATPLLKYLGGETESGQRESRERFAAALEVTVHRLAAAGQLRDRVALGRAAHHLVALARMAGAADLSLRAEQLEAAAPAATESELAPLVAAVKLRAEEVARNLCLPTAAASA